MCKPYLNAMACLWPRPLFTVGWRPCGGLYCSKIRGSENVLLRSMQSPLQETVLGISSARSCSLCWLLVKNNLCRDIAWKVFNGRLGAEEIWLFIFHLLHYPIFFSSSLCQMALVHGRLLLCRAYQKEYNEVCS